MFRLIFYRKIEGGILLQFTTEYIIINKNIYKKTINKIEIENINWTILI